MNKILNCKNLILKAEVEHNLSFAELYTILADDSINDFLFEKADEVRRKYVGDGILLRGLIEFSNICKNRCCYCGIRRDNTELHRYRLSEEQIVSLAGKAQEYGLASVVLQSGEDEWFDIERVCSIVQKLKTMKLGVTLSIGEKSYEEYKAYKDAGADGYLLRIETTDKNLYHKLDPEMSWEYRRQCLENLQNLGYEVASGIIVGLPEQTLESIATDICLFKQMRLPFVGLGPFIPHPCTPLGNAPKGDLILALKVMALSRLLLPNSIIPATTAMEAIHPQGRLLALQSGANALLPCVTQRHTQDYSLYPNKANAQAKAHEIVGELAEQFSNLGRYIVMA